MKTIFFAFIVMLSIGVLNSVETFAQKLNVKAGFTYMNLKFEDQHFSGIQEEMAFGRTFQENFNLMVGAKMSFTKDIATQKTCDYFTPFIALQYSSKEWKIIEPYLNCQIGYYLSNDEKEYRERNLPAKNTNPVGAQIGAGIQLAVFKNTIHSASKIYIEVNYQSITQNEKAIWGYGIGAGFRTYL